MNPNYFETQLTVELQLNDRILKAISESIRWQKTLIDHFIQLFDVIEVWMRF